MYHGYFVKIVSFIILEHFKTVQFQSCSYFLYFHLGKIRGEIQEFDKEGVGRAGCFPTFRLFPGKERLLPRSGRVSVPFVPVKESSFPR